MYPEIPSHTMVFLYSRQYYCPVQTKPACCQHELHLMYCTSTGRHFTLVRLNLMLYSLVAGGDMRICLASDAG